LINKENVESIVQENERIVDEIREKITLLKAENDPLINSDPIEYIKTVFNEEAKVIQFPINDPNFGGLVYYLNNRFYIYINTKQPKIYENFMWAHEFYHFRFDKDVIRDRNQHYMVTDTITDIRERYPNLFAAEFLINSFSLTRKYKSIQESFANEALELQILRMIPTFKLPYKALVIKMVQDKLIDIDQAKSIIDFNYKSNIPKDVDRTFFLPTENILVDNIEFKLSRAKDFFSDEDLNGTRRVVIRNLEKIYRWQSKE
jgi:Zn-dependent peptidase ImmA (M78 family)